MTYAAKRKEYLLKAAEKNQ
jgi:hypothetical protein